MITEVDASRYAFALLWYLGLSGLAYFVYIYYFLTWDHVWMMDNRVLHVLGACGMYVAIEILTLASTCLHHDVVACKRTTEHTHCIIAAHRAYESLVTTIPSVLKSFPAERIWVADNGYKDAQTELLCLELGVHYRFLDIGNKTYALYMVAKEVERYDPEAKNVVLLDDDTQLADSFFVRHDLLDRPLVAGYCVAIAIAKTPPWNLWEHLIDFEYRSISYRNGSKQSGTISFVHGICAVYKLRRMLLMYSKLCTMPHGLPFGEDAFVGLDFRLAGYRLLQDNQNLVHTFCPRQLVAVCGQGRTQGFGASSIWKQRVQRWYLSWIRRLPTELALGLCYDAGSWWGNIRYRIDLVWYLCLMIVSSFWFLFMVYILMYHKDLIVVGVLHGALALTSNVTGLIRYVGFPPLLRQGMNPCILLVWPLMNMLICVLMFSSMIISILWYIPFRRVDYRKCHQLAE